MKKAEKELRKEQRELRQAVDKLKLNPGRKQVIEGGTMFDPVMRDNFDKLIETGTWYKSHEIVHKLSVELGVYAWSIADDLLAYINHNEAISLMWDRDVVQGRTKNIRRLWFFPVVDDKAIIRFQITKKKEE